MSFLILDPTGTVVDTACSPTQAENVVLHYTRKTRQAHRWVRKS